MRYFSSPVRFHRQAFRCLKIFSKSQLGFLSQVPTAEDFVSVQIEVPQPNGSWNYKTPQVLQSLKQAVDRLDKSALPLGWRFTMPPEREELASVEDKALRHAYEELYRHIDAESSDWHEMLHDVGARGRHQAYVAMKPTAYVLGRRTASSG